MTAARDDARLRRVAFGVGYRMLGTVADAEDVAQSAMERLLASGAEPDNAEAWLTTVATRISLDQLRSARRQRELYVGDWLPEPLAEPGFGPAGAHAPAPDAAGRAELADDLSLAFLVLLETLTPAERAAFLLHDVFDFSYGETAAALERPSEAAARQLVSRARSRISGRMPRYEASADEQRDLVARFIAACESGDVAGFVDVLAADVVFTGDGGGRVPPGFAITRPVQGFTAVSRLLASFTHRAAEFPVRLVAATVGGGPGAAIVVDLPEGGGLLGVWGLSVDDGRITAVDGVINPDKLGHLVPEFGPLVSFPAIIAAIGASRGED